jgi:hypothetical protein
MRPFVPLCASALPVIIFLPIGSNNVFVNQFASLCGAGQEGFSVWSQRDLVRHQLGEIAGEPPAPNFLSRLLAETL